MAEPETEISIIHGTLEEFANGFTIRQSAQAESNLNNALPSIYHGSQNFPYEKIRNFLHREADIWIKADERIVNIKPVEHSEGSGTTSESKTLLQRFLQAFRR